MEPAVLIFAVAILAVPALLVLATLAMIGSLVATLADGRFAVVQPPQG